MKRITDMKIPLNKVIPAPELTGITSLLRSMCLEYYSANKNRLESVDLYFRLLLSKVNESVLSMKRISAVHEGFT